MAHWKVNEIRLCYEKCWPNFLSEATFSRTNFWFIIFSFLLHKILALVFNMFIYANVGHFKNRNVLLFNKITFKILVMYYLSTKSLSKYLTATFPTLHFLIASITWHNVYDRSRDTVTFKIINNRRREIQLIELVIYMLNKHR
jgi:hypothetical protein